MCSFSSTTLFYLIVVITLSHTLLSFPSLFIYSFISTLISLLIKRTFFRTFISIYYSRYHYSALTSPISTNCSTYHLTFYSLVCTFISLRVINFMTTLVMPTSSTLTISPTSISLLLMMMTCPILMTVYY